MPGYPSVNGQEYGFSSITVKVNNQNFFPTSIDYDDSLTPGRVDKSGSAIPAGTTRGVWDGSASMELTVADFAVFQTALAAQQASQPNSAGGIGLVIFSVQILYVEGTLGIVTDTLPAVRLMHVTKTPGGGSDASKVKCDLFLMAPILHNNVPIVADAPAIA